MLLRSGVGVVLGMLCHDDGVRAAGCRPGRVKCVCVCVWSGVAEVVDVGEVDVGFGR